ncbi:hypothetical protein AB0I53_11975 [Saccharopolyspora sp. NPDC050389]|uniref:hypothetical protein n=1 Tax=Saccharopolyspora sp. NPDC050389 TaxID=3155516 RepID=UPI0033F2B77D
MGILRPAAECLCEDCKHRILTRGWKPDQLFPPDNDCQACMETAMRTAARYPEGIIPSSSLQKTGQLTPEQFRAKVIRHEAAHAAVAHLLGMDVTRIYVGDTREDPVELGSVDWKFTGELNIEALAEVSMAGWVSDRKWLAENGLDDETHLVSVSSESRADIGVVLGRGAGGATVDLGVQRAEENWSDYAPYINAVAEELTYFDGDLTPLVMRAVIGEVDDRRRRSSAPSTAQPPARPSAPTTNTAPISGGSVMSTLAEQARNALNIANEKADFVRGALQQAGLDIDDIIAQLAQVTTDAETVQQASGIYQQAKADLEKLQGLVNTAIDTTQQHAGVL